MTQDRSSRTADPQTEGDSSATEELIQAGAEVAGGVAATALGFLGAGPAGALVGAGASPLIVRGLRWIGSEVKSRLISPRGEVRIGTTLAFAADEIRRRLEAGEKPRNDAFFQDEISAGRTAAEEVLEGTVLSAERAYEENKIPHIGKLYASIAFDPSIDRAMANYLLTLASSLTWTQYVILQVIAQNFHGVLELRETMFPPGEQHPQVIALAHEMLDLAQRSFLLQKRPGDDSSELILDAPHIAPRFLKIQGMAFTFFRLAKLEEIPPPQWAPVARLLGSNFPTPL
jgi:hypothetical protein